MSDLRVANALLAAAAECDSSADECYLDPMVADTWRDAAVMLRERALTFV